MKDLANQSVPTISAFCSGHRRHKHKQDKPPVHKGLTSYYRKTNNQINKELKDREEGQGKSSVTLYYLKA